MLASAREHYRRQQNIQREGLMRARARRFGPLAALVAAVSASQAAAATDARGAVGAMLTEQNIDADPDVEVNPRALAETANDGRTLEGLMAYAQTVEVSAAAFTMIVGTQVRDAARQSASLEIFARPKVSGYVRMLVPPSCSRCAVLAGRVYARNTGFQRHPSCDCRHIPTTEDTAGDLTTDPDAYFDSLPTAAELSERYPDLTVKQRREMDLVSQEDVFTVHGARAIRDGANIGQVVNARAGMSTAQEPLRGRGDRWTARGLKERRTVFGRELYTTTEGMTKRGTAYKARGRNYVRLMPESIYEIADDRADAIRLLKASGFIL